MSYMTNFKFTRSFASVLATVALVSSALTGLLYSTPVSAAGTNSASGVVPSTTTSTGSQTQLKQGQKTNFQFKVTKTSSGFAPIWVRLGNTIDGTPFADNQGVGKATAAKVWFEVNGVLNTSTTPNVDNLFNSFGVQSPSLNPNTDTLTVYIGTDSSKTDQGLVVNQPYSAGVVGELKIGILSSDSSASITQNYGTGGGPEKGEALYDVIPDITLSVKKQRISSGSDFNTFAGYTNAATDFNAFKALSANAGANYIFGISVENSGATTATGVKLTDALDSAASGYFFGGNLSAGTLTNTGVLLAPNFPTPALLASGSSTTINSNADLTIPGGTQSNPTKITYLAAFKRNTSNLPTTGNAGNNEFKINGFNESSDFSPSISFPIKGVAPISGGADLKVEKTANVSTVSSGSNVTYNIKITNTSTSNASTPTSLVDFVEVFGTGTTATTVASSVGVTPTPKFGTDTGEYVINVDDVKAAYQNAGAGTPIGATARVIPVKELAPGVTVTVSYTVTYQVSSTCPAEPGPAPRIRNTAALIDAPTAITGTALIPFTTSNGFYYGVLADNTGITWDSNSSSNSITVGTGISLYGDSNTNDNVSVVDLTPDVCKPDLQLLSKYRSTSLSGGSSTDALLGEEVEYTIEYANYGAQYATGLPKSQAKNVVVTDTLPDGFTFVKLVSPSTGATASVSGQTVTVSGLPNISLGDKDAKQVKLVIKAPVDKNKVGLTNIYNIARVSANNEDGVYDAADKGPRVDNTGNTVAAGLPDISIIGTRIGNNSGRAQITLKGGPDLQVVKTVDIGEGQLKADTNALQYTIKIKNVGTENANGVQLRDVFDSCTTFDAKVSGPDGTLNSDQRTIDYAIGNLNVDQEVTVVFKAKITSRTNPCDNKISNVATAWLTSGQSDINKANDSSTANSTTFPINTNADLMKTVDQLSAQPGTTLTYTITFKASNADFKGKLEDQLADKVTFVSATPAVTSSANNKLVWEIPNLKKGDQIVATVKVTVKGDASGTVVNSAVATTTDGKITLSNNAVTSIEVAGNSKITGYVYFDANRNGKEEAKERDAAYADYLGGITVVAKYSNGKETRVTTDKTGAFAFDKLVAGKYTIAIDINTVKGSYKNVQLNVAAVGDSADGLSKVQEVPVGGTINLTAGFRLFTGQTSTGAVANGASSLTALVALLSFSFLATLAYSEARKRALSL